MVPYRGNPWLPLCLLTPLNLQHVCSQISLFKENKAIWGQLMCFVHIVGFCCFLCPTHLNRLPEFPAQHVTQLWKGLVTSRSFNCGLFCLSRTVIKWQMGVLHRPTQRHTGQQPCPHIFSSLRAIKTPINLIGKAFIFRRKPEYLETTHWFAWRICKLHAERLPAGIQTQHHQYH